MSFSDAVNEQLAAAAQQTAGQEEWARQQAEAKQARLRTSRIAYDQLLPDLKTAGGLAVQAMAAGRISPLITLVRRDPKPRHMGRREARRISSGQQAQPAPRIELAGWSITRSYINLPGTPPASDARNSNGELDQGYMNTTGWQDLLIDTSGLPYLVDHVGTVDDNVGTIYDPYAFGRNSKLSRPNQRLIFASTTNLSHNPLTLGERVGDGDLANFPTDVLTEGIANFVHYVNTIE